MDGGFVYVMSTPSMPGLFKIGQTTNISKRRAQLSSSTSIPMPYTCDHKVFVQQHVEFEKAIHKELEQFRVNENKESPGDHQTRLSDGPFQALWDRVPSRG